LSVLFIFTMTSCSVGKTTLVRATYESEETVEKIALSDINMNIEVIESDLYDHVYISYYQNSKLYYAFTFVRSSNTLKVQRKDERGAFSSGSYADDYTTTIYLPTDYSGSLDITTTNNNIKVTDGVLDEVRLNATNGELRVSNTSATKDATLKTTNGSIYVEQSSFEALLKIETTNSETISLTEVTAKDNIEVKSSNSSLNFKDVTTGAKYIVDLTNGSVTMREVDFTDSCTVTVSTGSITMSLKGSRDDYAIDASTNLGDITAKLPTSGAKKATLKVASNGNIKVTFIG